MPTWLGVFSSLRTAAETVPAQETRTRCQGWQPPSLGRRRAAAQDAAWGFGFGLQTVGAP